MISLSSIVDKCVKTIKEQLEERANEVSIELRNTELEVNTGARSGRVYGSHVASAPGESPASHTGTFKSSFIPKVEVRGDSYVSSINSNVSVGRFNQAELLENGSPGGKLAPRPYAKKVVEQTKEKANEIYSKPYL